eukprot:TRINITY_DN11378_c0_g1_i7.p1 TRINITY_DN11378_c0_g1~~TRINITY_DN11378_c0_g1_i7.p1  ORF type:complete len:119 (-),score=12.11 TRINITY_DN11378_c0_g1_i7:96-452(-)
MVGNSLNNMSSSGSGSGSGNGNGNGSGSLGSSGMGLSTTMGHLPAATFASSLGHSSSSAHLTTSFSNIVTVNGVEEDSHHSRVRVPTRHKPAEPFSMLVVNAPPHTGKPTRLKPLPAV